MACVSSSIGVSTAGSSLGAATGVSTRRQRRRRRVHEDNNTVAESRVDYTVPSQSRGRVIGTLLRDDTIELENLVPSIRDAAALSCATSMIERMRTFMRTNAQDDLTNERELSDSLIESAQLIENIRSRVPMAPGHHRVPFPPLPPLIPQRDDGMFVLMDVTNELAELPTSLDNTILAAMDSHWNPTDGVILKHCFD